MKRTLSLLAMTAALMLLAWAFGLAIQVLNLQSIVIVLTAAIVVWWLAVRLRA